MWKSFDFGPELKTRTKLHAKNGKDIGSNTKAVDGEIRRSANFHNELVPKSVDDLAVNLKKIGEIEEWLTLNVLNQEMTQCPFLLLSGPTGCGKTITLNVLCKKIGIEISEWINPADQDYELFKEANQLTRFIEFLNDSKWNSLFDSVNAKKITLVKDFPNVIVHRPDEFCSILNECYDQLTYPIVFISTDGFYNSINCTRSLFTEDVMKKYNFSHISFNTCAPSLMRKAMKRAQIIIQENSTVYQQPIPSTIDAILATAMGDIRNCMNQLSVACLLGTVDPPAVKDVKINNKRKRHNGTLLQSMSRDEYLGLFHGLGRVLNPKRKELGNSWRLNCDIEKLVEEFSIKPALFISFLSENYLKYFGNINDASNAAQILSLSVNFLDHWTNKHDTIIFGLWISVLGLMIYNEHKVSKWNQIRGPTKITNHSNNNDETTRLTPVDYFYYSTIKGTNTFHKFINLV